MRGFILMKEKQMNKGKTNHRLWREFFVPFPFSSLLFYNGVKRKHEKSKGKRGKEPKNEERPGKGKVSG